MMPVISRKDRPFVVGIVVVDAEGIAADGTEVDSDPTNVARFLLFRFGTSLLTTSIAPLVIPKPTSCAWAAVVLGVLPGEGGGVRLESAATCLGWCENPSGRGGATKPNFFRYCSCAVVGAMPSSSAGSKLKVAIVPSDDTAYRVRPSVDLEQLRQWMHRTRYPH